MSLDLYLTDPPCPTCGHADTYWSWNITHNLNQMAKAAGVYEVLWRPEEVWEDPRAREAIGILDAGLKQLREDPDAFRKFNPENGWGKYEDLVEFVEETLEACKRWPHAVLQASR